MGEAGEIVNPYVYSPGSSTPGAAVSAEEGKADLWAFFWLALANSAIIVVAGLGAWFLVHH